jgi:two-component system LytT family response regulator
MQKIKCLLVDDEPLAITLLKQYIAQIDLLEVAGDCPNAVRALEVLRTGDIDLLFLDIRMPSLSGLELLKLLRHPPKVIITTAHREYALDGYDLDLVDYLLKPITFDRFLKAIQRLLRQIDQPPPQAATAVAATATNAAAAAAAEPQLLYIKSGYRNIRLGTDTILYMESLKDYVKIHTPTGAITTKYKISEMEAELGTTNFLRIHRSFIVNLKHITAYTSSHIEIGRTELPIGESYKEYVLKVIRNAGC